MIAYWQECLKLARRMIRVFALALDLPETHFDGVVGYPGADGVLNYCRLPNPPVPQVRGGAPDQD
jgi:isopenicillin N synthase-like dioxygenase